VVAGLLLFAALAALGAMTLPGPALAGDRTDQAGGQNGCTAAVTSRAEPDTVRDCEPSTVSLSLQPTCPICPGGMKVVFVQREIATESRWMNNEALDVLETLRQQYGSAGLSAAVVQYGPGRARAAVAMTDKLDLVRSALSRSQAAANPPDHNNAASSAAREAIRQLQPGAGESPDLEPCKLVLFFAQDSPTPG